MTANEVKIAVWLGCCSFLPGCWDKRYARDMARLAKDNPAKELSRLQSETLIRLAHKYRRQMPTRALLAALDEGEARADA